MKTLNLLQNMSAEAKVLAMALPMLLLGALSAMAEKIGLNEIHIIDMPSCVPQPGDSASVQPVGYPFQEPVSYKQYPLPSQKPEDAGLDHWYVGRGFPGPSVSSDSASVEPAQKPEVDKRIIAPMPHVTNGEPEEDGLLKSAFPGDDDVYESVHISDNHPYPAGIEEVAVENQPAQTAQGVFTLSGLRVSESADLSGLAPGLYIVNGKKMLIR